MAISGKTSRFLILCCLFIVSGCAKSWQPTWQYCAIPTPNAESERLLVEARKTYDRAGDWQGLIKSMDGYRAVLKSDPGNAEALAYLSNQHILLGTAYEKSRWNKAEHFRKALYYAEHAMYTNDDFKKAVDTGDKPWEAADTLQAEDAPAMLFWVTALQYEFKEGMSIIGKVSNIRWMKHGLTFLDRIKEVAPNYGSGAVEFAYAICYSILPESMGGNEEKAIQLMQQAIDDNPNYLMPRWGRGKYLYQVNGDTDTSLADLKWIANQDVSNFNDAYPWKIHFMEDTREILKKLDQ